MKSVKKMSDDKLNFWAWTYLAVALFMFPGVFLWIWPLIPLEDLAEFFMLLSWPFGLWCCIRGLQLSRELDRRKRQTNRGGKRDWKQRT